MAAQDQQFYRIVDLPPAQTPLTGMEAFEAVQNGISVQTTLAQMIAGQASCSIRQLKQALVIEDLFDTISQAVPGYAGNVINIEWNTGGGFYVNDGLYVLIETTLSYSTAQMNALIALALQQQT